MYVMRSRLVVVAALVFGLVVAAAAQPQPRGRMQLPIQGRPLPPRDTSARRAPPPEGTATISGRVLAADSGRPLRRASIRATPRRTAGTNDGMRSFAMLTARTDDEGRYVIRHVPAGEYEINVSKAGYVNGIFGQPRPNTPGRSLVVADGSALTAVDVRLVRGGVIVARVVDDGGDPAENVRVSALRVQRQQGERTTMTQTSAMTDDLGLVRLYGLPPGNYLVRADFNARPPSMTDASAEATDLVPTYAPSVTDPAEAQMFQVQAGAETPMDLQLVVARVATIRGRVTTSSGQPATRGFVSLHATGGPSPNGAMAVSNGEFELRNVAPGTYTLDVQAGFGGAPGLLDQGDFERAIETIAVDGQDLAVSVTTRRGTTARGRIVVEGGNPSALAGRPLRLFAVAQQRRPSFGRPGVGTVAPDLSFELTGMHGVQSVSLMGLPEGWTLRDVRLDGVSALDGLDFGYGRTITGLEVVVTNEPTGITGTVATPDAGVASEASILVFSTDERHWEPTPSMRPRLRLGSLASNGTFRFAELRPGSYYVVALPPGQADYDDVMEPDTLRQLAARARTVDVEEGQLTNVRLTLVER